MCPASGRLSISLMVGLAAVLAAAVAGAALSARLLGQPAAATADPPDRAAGLRAQHRLAELLMRSGGLAGHDRPVSLTATELNALLTRHVEARRLPLFPVVVHAGDGVLALAGRTSLRQLGPGSALHGLTTTLPGALLDLDLWVTVEGRLTVQAGDGEFVVERAAIGRQPVPPRWVWAVLGVDPRDYLVWRMPRVVAGVEVQPGRLLIHTRR
jgi:hypothetical protein